jgi:hypothetical protein
MDADFSHNPSADIQVLYETCHIHGADLAIGG